YFFLLIAISFLEPQVEPVVFINTIKRVIYSLDNSFSYNTILLKIYNINYELMKINNKNNLNIIDTR
ncbi:hypothetical protein ACEE25_13835, partial [Clostridium perfringens]